MYQVQTLQYVAGYFFIYFFAMVQHVWVSRLLTTHFKPPGTAVKGTACSSCPEAIHTYFRYLHTHIEQREWDTWQSALSVNLCLRFLFEPGCGRYIRMTNSRGEHLEDTAHGTTLIYFYYSAEEKKQSHTKSVFKDQPKWSTFLNSAQRVFIMQTLCFKTCIKSSDVRWGK